MKIPCFIIHYNRPHYLKQCVEALSKEERLQLIIIDNCSDEQLRPKIDNDEVVVLKMKQNYGHTVLWKMFSGLLEIDCLPNERCQKVRDVISNGCYIVTDCDIVVPYKHDWLSVLLDGMKRMPQYNKFGLGLDTRHIPHSYPLREEVLHHENRVIHKRKIPYANFIEAPVDTTLALYRAGYFHYSVWGTEEPLRWQGECKCVRTTGMYEATHLTWQLTKEEYYGEENQKYIASVKKGSSHWS